jgi:hypothetical protein
MKFLFVQYVKKFVAISCAWRLSVRKQSKYGGGGGGGGGGC